MTLVKNHREYTVELSSRCCNPGVEDELVSGEAPYSNTHLSMQQQMRR